MRQGRDITELLVSIIIPAYNGATTLPECLAACLAQDYPRFEIIVVDDGSTDGTADVARGFDGVHVVKQTNLGPAAARNRGAQEAQGDVLAYTDADCVPRTDWLSRLMERFDDEVVAVGGTYACANPGSRLARLVQAEIDRRHENFQADVDFLGSFNVAYRADAFRATEGFDDSYPSASGEDNDLAYRLQDAGGRLRFTPEAIVAHYHPEHLLPYLRTQARHGYWRMKLYRDHPKRARGDQYAGWPDLLAPPLGLLDAGLAPFLGLSVWWAGYSAAVAGTYGALALFYLALHVPMAWRLRSALTPGDLLYFGGMASLRDIARAAGLVRGLWSFAILGRRA